jgi:uncharacterized membrane protein YfcA
MAIVFFVVCFLASTVGAICGIGGGVIIKPVLDSFGVLNVTALSFLSGCTVLSMTTYSVIKSKLNGTSDIKQPVGLALAVGAAFGGVGGKWIFSFVASLSSEQKQVGMIQSISLLIVTVSTLWYTICKDRIKTYRLQHVGICILSGALLGVMSSFLGIGGGPINLVVLYFLFSMTTKEAVEESLYIIFFSQLASVVTTVLSGAVPKFPVVILIVMVVGGLGGGVIGRKINKNIAEQTVEKLFIALMVVMILINTYNIYLFI